MHTTIRLLEQDRHYLDSSARVRGISAAELVRRVMRVVLSDQLIFGILDDGASRVGNSRYTPPRDALFAGLPHSYASHVERARAQK